MSDRSFDDLVPIAARFEAPDAARVTVADDQLESVGHETRSHPAAHVPEADEAHDPSRRAAVVPSLE